MAKSRKKTSAKELKNVIIPEPGNELTERFFLAISKPSNFFPVLIFAIGVFAQE